MTTKINFVSFCEDHNIDYAEEGHKHCRPGWIQIECPFCTGNPGYHLGYNIHFGYFNCWRCGAHSLFEVIEETTQATEKKNVYNIIKEYQDGEVDEDINNLVSKITQKTKIDLPPGTTELKKAHKTYLRNRKFDPDEIAAIWGIKGTGFLGGYNYRIIAPIYFQNKLVSYQGRDITGKAELRYKACALKDEIIHHKELLYGFDLVPSNTIVIVEGITDAWRLGPGAVATFGIKYKQEQVFLASQFNTRYIFFDPEDEAAQDQAENLGNELSGFAGSTQLVKCRGIKDPGSMPGKEARKFMREIGL